VLGREAQLGAPGRLGALVRVAPQAPLDLQEPLAPRVLLEHQALRDRQALLALQAPLDRLDRRGPLALPALSRDRLDPPGRLDRKALPDLVEAVEAA
jgi:hypothetical protein